MVDFLWAYDYRNSSDLPDILCSFKSLKIVSLTGKKAELIFINNAQSRHLVI